MDRTDFIENVEQLLDFMFEVMSAAVSLSVLPSVF